MPGEHKPPCLMSITYCLRQKSTYLYSRPDVTAVAMISLDPHSTVRLVFPFNTFYFFPMK